MMSPRSKRISSVKGEVPTYPLLSLHKYYMLPMAEAQPRMFSADETVADLLGIHIVYLPPCAAIASLGRACECEEEYSDAVMPGGVMYTTTCR